MVSPSHKKRAVQYVVDQGLCSTRRTCRVVGLATSSYYHRPQGPTQRQHRLEQRIITLSNQYPRWGYRLIHQLLCREGWTVNRKRVQRVRRQAGCGVRPGRKRNRRSRSARRAPVQAAYPGHVWSWDFILDRTTDGRPVKMLTMMDEYTRQCLVVHPARSIPSAQVLDTLQALVATWGAPAFIRSDNGSEFIARGALSPRFRRCISSQAARGKMASSKVFIAVFETNVLRQKSSFLSPKPASSSRTIGACTTNNDPIVASDIKHPMNLPEP